VGKNDLLLHFVESHKQAVSVHLAYKLQAAVVNHLWLCSYHGGQPSLHPNIQKSGAPPKNKTHCKVLSLCA